MMLCVAYVGKEVADKCEMTWDATMYISRRREEVFFFSKDI